MVAPFDKLEVDFFGDLAGDTHGFWQVFEFVRLHYPKLNDEQVFERGRNYIMRWATQVGFASVTRHFIHPPLPIGRTASSFSSNTVWLPLATWRIHPPLILQTKPGVFMRTKPSNQALERTATRSAFTFCVAKTFSLGATLAPGGRRSAPSR
jgi:hypothetical protein